MVKLANSPFKDEGEGGNGGGGEGVAVDDEDVVAHAAVEGHFGNNVHPRISELERGHGDVRLRLLEEIAEASFPFHLF